MSQSAITMEPDLQIPHHNPCHCDLASMTTFLSCPPHQWRCQLDCSHNRHCLQTQDPGMTLNHLTLRKKLLWKKYFGCYCWIYLLNLIPRIKYFNF